MGPYGPDFAQKIKNFNKNHKITNKNLEILKVKTWFSDKDLT